MALRPSDIKMTLGSELAVEPPIGAGIITVREGFIWAFIHSGSPNIPVEDAHWVAATVKQDRFYTWRDIKKEHQILVVFEAKTRRMPRLT